MDISKIDPSWFSEPFDRDMQLSIMNEQLRYALNSAADAILTTSTPVEMKHNNDFYIHLCETEDMEEFMDEIQRAVESNQGFHVGIAQWACLGLIAAWAHAGGKLQELQQEFDEQQQPADSEAKATPK